MSDRFDECLREVLKHEGGYSNHPKDPGGATNFGVTQKVYDGYRLMQGEDTRDVRQIEQDELRDIYKRQYWDAVAGDRLPDGIDLVVFDFAVNSGVSRAAKTLQQAVESKTDGHIGTITLEAARTGDAEDVIRKVSSLRMAFLKRLSTFRTFGKGWTKRVNEVQAKALSMAGAVPAFMGFAEIPQSRKANDEDMSVSSSMTGKGAATSGVGVMGSMVSDAADKISYVADYSDILRIVFVGLMLLGVGITVWGLYKSQQAGEIV